MELSMILILVGVVVLFAAFSFTAFNMISGFSNDREFESTFASHIGGMVVMALGGIILFIGLIMKGYDVIAMLSSR